MPDFPADEFDEIAQRRSPLGAHRKHRPKVMRWIAPFLVLVLGGLAGYGVVVYLWWDSGGEGLPPQEQETPTITQTRLVVPTFDVPTLEASPTTSESPTPTVDPVNFDAQVVTLNGAGIAGLAGRTAETVEAAGFTNVDAGNLSSSDRPSANVVRYRDPALEATAQEVADALGIATVEQGIVPAGDISVLLVSDPDA